MRQQKQRQPCRQDTQRACDEERVLTRAHGIRRILLYNREHIGADEGADFAQRGRDAVVLATHGRGAGFRRDEADVIARPKFAEGEEDAVYIVKSE